MVVSQQRIDERKLKSDSEFFATFGAVPWTREKMREKFRWLNTPQVKHLPLVQRLVWLGQKLKGFPLVKTLSVILLYCIYERRWIQARAPLGLSIMLLSLGTKYKMAKLS